MNDLAGQPFYHLRPNKSIDRSLFIQTLIGLSRVLPISSYKYTGFGSYSFDDFKLLHDLLNIHNLISLEKEEDSYKRAEFNLPYGCINLKFSTSTDYISGLDIGDKEHNIFWLDFVSPSELGRQLADYMTLLGKLNPNDIVRITLNANPSSLGSDSPPDQLQKTRLQKLKERVEENYIPSWISEGDVTTAKYPLTLLNILKKATFFCLSQNTEQKNFMLPLFSSVYADGQQMVTFTGIILNNSRRESVIKRSLKAYPHVNFSWNDPSKIAIPHLTVREITEINKMLPTAEMKRLKQEFPFVFFNDDDLNSYLSFYKYYPNYHQVSF